MVINSMKDKEGRTETKQKRFKKEGRKNGQKGRNNTMNKTRYLKDNAETFV